MDKGWVKLHRQIAENTFLMNDDNAYLLFTKLLLQVTKTKGQWAGGRRQLAELVHMKEGTLYDTLKRLESQQMIYIEPNKKYSVITICKWSEYQSQPNHLKTKNPTNTQPLANHNPTMSQHSNKNKNKKENKKRELLILDKSEQPSKGIEYARQVADKVRIKALGGRVTQ